MPPYINDGNAYVSARISPGTDADMQNPDPDPGEEYQHVNTALFGVVDPPANQFRTAAADAPAVEQPEPRADGDDDGIRAGLLQQLRRDQGPQPHVRRVSRDHGQLRSEQLPVISTLAREFAVYDAWYCSVPSQTLTNRSFFHASTASGYMVNVPYMKWLTTNDSPTIFNRLQDAGLTWRVYYDETQIVPMTALIHAPDAVSVLEDELRHDDRFLQRRG